jgi:hypothetical protein
VGQKLSVTFTPADSVRYTTATAATQITVVAGSTKPANLTPASAVASRDAARNVLVTVTFKNLGGAAASIPITIAALGGFAAIDLPAIGPVAELGSASVTLKFPSMVQTGGGTLVVFTATGGAALSVTVP